MTQLPDKYLKLRELSEKATKGPWYQRNSFNELGGRNGYDIVRINEDETEIVLGDEDLPDYISGEFIVEARNQIDPLLADLEMAMEALEFYVRNVHESEISPGIRRPAGSIAKEALEKINRS